MTPLSQYVFTLDGIAIAAAVEYQAWPFERTMTVVMCPMEWWPWIVKYIHGPISRPFAEREGPSIPSRDAEMICYFNDGYTYVWTGATPQELTPMLASNAAHEAVHVVASIMDSTGQAEILTMSNQEPFAYLLTRATHAILTAFTENHSAPLHYVPLVPGDPGIYFDATSPLHSEAVALKTRASMPLRDSAS